MAGPVTTKTENGNGKPAQQMKPLPESRRQKMAAGLAAFQELEHEKDELQRLLSETELKLRGVEAELSATLAAMSRQQTEIETYRRERDNAVAKRAEVEAVFNAALAVMTKYRGETVIEETEGAGDAGAADGNQAG